MKVRIGYGLGNLRPLSGDALGALAEGLERNGFDSLWLSERISGPAPDPVVALTFAAARTKKIKLGTSVSVLPAMLGMRELSTYTQMGYGVDQAIDIVLSNANPIVEGDAQFALVFAGELGRHLPARVSDRFVVCGTFAVGLGGFVKFLQ